MTLDGEIPGITGVHGTADQEHLGMSSRQSAIARAGLTKPHFAAWKLYLLLVVPAAILLNLAFPNFHAPDDYDHLKRGYTLFHHPFRMITPAGGSTGAMIDSGLASYINSQIPVVKFQLPLDRLERISYTGNGQIKWTGKTTFSEMPGSLNYFPLLYAPQGMMLEVGRLTNSSVKTSVLWARIANSFVGIALAALGLYLLPSGRSLALLMLLLPRTLLQFASNSADPILYGLALIIIAMPLRYSEATAIRSGFTAAMIFISASVRLPLAALALTGSIDALRKRQWLNLAAIIASCTAALVWVLTTLPLVTDRRCHASGPVAQKLIAFSLDWPLLIGRTFIDQAGFFYAGFVGHYAWGNAPIGYVGIPMPNWIYATACPLLGFALWQDLATPAPAPPSVRASLLVGAACSILLTFLALYIGCTMAGGSIVRGIQGRYFVPPLFAVGAALGGLAAGRARSYPDLYSKLIIAWVATCTITMLGNASQLYS